MCVVFFLLFFSFLLLLQETYGKSLLFSSLKNVTPCILIWVTDFLGFFFMSIDIFYKVWQHLLKLLFGRMGKKKRGCSTCHPTGRKPGEKNLVLKTNEDQALFFVLVWCWSPDATPQSLYTHNTSLRLSIFLPDHKSRRTQPDYLCRLNNLLLDHVTDN